MITIFYFFCMLNLSKAKAFEKYTYKPVGNDAVHLKQYTSKPVGNDVVVSNFRIYPGS